MNDADLKTLTIFAYGTVNSAVTLHVSK